MLKKIFSRCFKVLVLGNTYIATTHSLAPAYLEDLLREFDVVILTQHFTSVTSLEQLFEHLEGLVGEENSDFETIFSKGSKITLLSAESLCLEKFLEGSELDFSSISSPKNYFAIDYRISFLDLSNLLKVRRSYYEVDYTEIEQTAYERSYEKLELADAIEPAQQEIDIVSLNLMSSEALLLRENLKFSRYYMFHFNFKDTFWDHYIYVIRLGSFAIAVATYFLVNLELTNTNFAQIIDLISNRVLIFFMVLLLIQVAFNFWDSHNKLSDSFEDYDDYID